MKTDRIQNQRIYFVSAAALLGISMFGMSSSALADSSFQNSCKSPDVAKDLLTAICLDKNGERRNASLTLMGIENEDGQLVDTGDRETASTFQKSCADFRVNGNVLSASCLTSGGVLRTSSLELDGIANDNGNLVYED